MSTIVVLTDTLYYVSGVDYRSGKLHMIPVDFNNDLCTNYPNRLAYLPSSVQLATDADIQSFMIQNVVNSISGPMKEKYDWMSKSCLPKNKAIKGKDTWKEV